MIASVVFVVVNTTYSSKVSRVSFWLNAYHSSDSAGTSNFCWNRGFQMVSGLPAGYVDREWFQYTLMEVHSYLLLPRKSQNFIMGSLRFSANKNKSGNKSNDVTH